jgi:hypothetical protein
MHREICPLAGTVKAGMSSFPWDVPLYGEVALAARVRACCNANFGVQAIGAQQREAAKEFFRTECEDAPDST